MKKQKNHLYAGSGEGIQIECGEVGGISRQHTEGAAFREMVKAAGKDCLLAEIARFRMVKVRTGKNGYLICGPWLYQDPKALYNTK